ncbi:hypothetical protein J4E83_010555 [Alternaria metachromatica]|uniref:uncharacterized protein n=1 Tax=Alternaria metachromatica TaxID=283354 RepID=UPI0020C358A0|nr:uncharacterized protein J4E83_010555 [Alternaria metachromatica]KAI4605562.1 hypothetical protein J4E83_010555 [Alternaria metachromatica]
MSSNRRIPLLLTIMALTSASLAAPTQPDPTPQLEDLQCRCLTFSTSRTPTPCSYQELLTLDWEAAFSLSITNALPIQFASQTTMDTLLAIPKPLPLNLLQSMHEGGESCLFFSRTGAIMLEGDEKALRAEFDALTAEVEALTAEVKAETRRLPTDYS